MILPRLAFAALVGASVVLSGCVSSIPSYSTDPATSASLKGARSKAKVTALPPGFDDTGSIICRAVGPVTLPTGQTFSQYVADALRVELASAGAHDPQGGVELRMKLVRVDFQTTLGATNWYIDGEYAIGGSSYVVSTVYNDRSSYLGDKACANVALYFKPALARHIRDVFGHPTFRSQVGLQ